MLTQAAEFERYKTRAHALLKKADENGGAGGRDITGILTYSDVFRLMLTYADVC